MGALKDRLRHDASHGAIYDADRRYIMMRADVLMGLLHQVPGEQRAMLLQAMADSVAENGGRSAQAYFQSLRGDAKAFLDTMTQSSADVGWGVWRFHQDAEGFEPVDLEHLHRGFWLIVHHSPFAHGHGPSETPVCAPIQGMLRAVGHLLVADNAEVVETQCAAQGHSHCRFHLAPAGLGQW